MNKLKVFFIRFLVVILALQGVVGAWLITIKPVQAAGTPEVRINELMWMGSSAGAEDQWIELYNAGSAPADLGGMVLTNVVNGSSAYIFPSATIIDPGSFMLLGASGHSTILTVPLDLSIDSFGLSNPLCQPINLVQVSGFMLTIVDSVTCDGTDYYEGDAITKQSMERIDPHQSGNTPTNWQTSIQQVNVTDSFSHDVEVNYASAKAPNTDLTAPVVAAVRDGLNGTTDADISQDTTTFSGNWDKFTDPESGIAKYQFAMSTDSNCAGVSWADTGNNGADRSFTLSALSLGDDVYYTCVRAIDRQGLLSPTAISDGLVVDATGSLITDFTLSDVNPDNGDQADAAWSVANGVKDLIHTFHLTITAPGFSQETEVAGSERQSRFGGLTTGTTYTATVVARDQLNNEGQVKTSNPLTTTDEVAPSVDPTRLVVGQNRPGTNDTVAGKSNTVNETATVNVLDRNPSLPGALLIGSVASALDQSFPAISIGNNTHPTAWVQAVDPSGNASVGIQVLNDTIAPNAPTLTNLKAECPANCQIELNWQDNGPDTDHYQVGYTPEGGVEQRTFDLTTTAVALSLPADTAYDFVVYGFDAAGNASGRSNLFHAQLTRGVATTISLVNGEPTTSTTGLSGAQEVITTNQPTAPLTVKAAEPTDLSPTEPITANATQRDWTKIFVVIILLLIIAAGFYLLSRTIGEDEEPPAGGAISSGKRRR